MSVKGASDDSLRWPITRLWSNVTLLLSIVVSPRTESHDANFVATGGTGSYQNGKLQYRHSRQIRHHDHYRFSVFRSAIGIIIRAIAITIWVTHLIEFGDRSKSLASITDIQMKIRWELGNLWDMNKNYIPHGIIGVMCPWKQLFFPGGVHYTWRVLLINCHGILFSWMELAPWFIARKLMTASHRLSKQSWGWWFETPSHSLSRHCNAGDTPLHEPLLAHYSNTCTLPVLDIRLAELLLHNSVG